MVIYKIQKHTDVASLSDLFYQNDRKWMMTKVSYAIMAMTIIGPTRIFSLTFCLQLQKVSKKKPRLFSFFNAKIPQKLLNEKNSPYRYCFDLSLHELR
jgi:hypothetical protein